MKGQTKEIKGQTKRKERDKQKENERDKQKKMKGTTKRK